ncbi:MAP kinase kinase (MEK) [Rhodotorula toruloides]
MDPPTPQGPGEDADSLSGLLGRRSKNRNKKGLALTAEATKPGTLSGASAVDLLKAPAPPVPSRPQPIQVTGSSRSKRNSVISLDSADTVSPQLPTTPSLSSSSTSSRSYHNQLNEQLASLELGVEFRIDLRNEDLEVLDELGSGNGGTVSRVLHVPTKAVMAKKVVHIATSDSTRKQILRELQIMHDCSSPFIVSFYGAYLQDPHICMCMEYMDKGSLDSIYRRIGPIPEPVIGKIALAVVSGLTYLYEVHKIMHRDVKPSNILLNSAGQIKICDFGVSGELINSVADTFVGTSTYMSPERISGEPYTVKSDVWSLGITLIEIAIGRFPFSSDDDASSSDDDADAALARLSLNVDEATDEMRDSFGDDLDDTLSPARPEKKRESILLAEERRASKRDSARPSRAIQRQKPRKTARGVTLAGSGHQMSILELLQHIVNEPAPHLPPGRFSSAAEEFVDATLRKEPIGWNVKKKGPLPQALARPTPKELLEYAWIREAAAADTDIQAFARSIP